MCEPALNDRVRLSQSVPELWLERGDEGVSCSVWSSSRRFYEVEFKRVGESFGVRALIDGDQPQIVDVAENDRSVPTRE
jgi:hypothetical protein